MPEPKTAWKEPHWDDCLAVLDFVSRPSGTRWLPYGEDLKPGTLIATLAKKTGYGRHLIENAIKTLESYGYLEVERLSHPFPCQHNFVLWVRRRGEKNWLTEPVYMWEQTSHRSAGSPGVYLATIDGRRIA